MSHEKKLILPYLPENLETLHKQEEENRSKSILHINADSILKKHLDIVYASLNILYDLAKSYKSQSDDELTIQYLGIRLFNSIVSALKLLLGGYYQNSVMLQRDILETGFLLDFFSIDKSNISNWKKSDNQARYKNYKPSKIRKKLDNRDGLKEKKRWQRYQRMCEYAAHPTYPGFNLTSQNGLGTIGPFFNEKFLIALIQELAEIVPLFTLIFLGHFNNLPENFLLAKSDFVDKIKA